MGAAKKRQRAQAEWMNGLSEQERIVFVVAKAAHTNIVQALGATGMCYRMTFFFTQYLKKEHGIEVVPVVGYVNDGTEEHLMISHAWIEYNGKKTDIALTQTAHQEQLPGPLLILDQSLTNAKAIYTYHRDRGPEAIALVQKLMGDPNVGHIIADKEQEHFRMTATAKSPALIAAYLNNAPDKMTYEIFADLVRGSAPRA